jgi:hypothetical protein
MISACAAGNPERMNRIRWAALSESERAWLGSLLGTPGFNVTCEIQQWWRETRLRDLVRLTLQALGPEQSARVIREYFRTHPCDSLFFLPESLSFLEYVEAVTDHPGLLAIIRFEKKYLRAIEANEPFEVDAEEVWRIWQAQFEPNGSAMFSAE